MDIRHRHAAARQVGLNKGEAHHALKNALRIVRQGEIRDRTTEGQHYRIAGLNLLTAIIVYWNTVRLGHVAVRRLATPDKIMRMDQDSFLLLRQGRDPLVVGKIRYYTEREFVRLADPA